MQDFPIDPLIFLREVLILGEDEYCPQVMFDKKIEMPILEIIRVPDLNAILISARQTLEKHLKIFNELEFGGQDIDPLSTVAQTTNQGQPTAPPTKPVRTPGVMSPKVHHFPQM